MVRNPITMITSSAKHAMFALPAFNVQHVEVTVIDLTGIPATEVINSGEKCAAFIESFHLCSMPKEDLINLDHTLAMIFAADNESILDYNEQMNFTLDGIEFWLERK